MFKLGVDYPKVDTSMSNEDVKKLRDEWHQKSKEAIHTYYDFDTTYGMLQVSQAVRKVYTYYYRCYNNRTHAAMQPDDDDEA